MNRRVGLALAAVAAFGLVAWLLASRERAVPPRSQAQAPSPAAGQGAPTQRPPSAQAPARPGPTAAATAPQAPARPAEPGAGERLLALQRQNYRPANYLRLSNGEPARSPADDTDHATLRRIEALLQPDPQQSAKIGELWRTHEDGRRALLPVKKRLSGPTLLDPEKLKVLDASLLGGLEQVLNPEQRQRLRLELAPDGVPQENQLYNPAPVYTRDQPPQ